jgi:hypothetical protein
MNSNRYDKIFRETSSIMYLQNNFYLPTATYVEQDNFVV